jgi:hypothetical protein
MLINEQGWKYTEKITFDMTKKTVVRQVPAHRHLNESNVMEDFVSVSIAFHKNGQYYSINCTVNKLKYAY